MKFKSIVGVLFPILVLFVILQNPYKTEGKTNSLRNAVQNSSSMMVADAYVDETSENTSYNQYTNTTSHDVKLDVSNIKLTCRGTGSSREKDEVLAEQNMQINATFSKEKNGERSNQIILGSGETTYIFVTTEYTGETRPENEVNCGYQIAVNIGM